ncbi:MAG: helix-turn-helix transcriptional regulator [Lachnospiraceae bacterium]|nr:helix-turn-helix transcriptional regulator [Lachnospiraceae bacterium]
MPMNLIIQERRKALGLTQEQVAKYLNVSIPAVSKWESGATNPDISLLVPLARLLKTDLNTLLCFQEDISQQEIGYFCREINSLVQTSGIASGFQAAAEKLHEYPHNETLLHCLTFQLDGLLILSGLSEEEMDPYNTLLAKWYCKLAESSDSKIRNSADYMRVSRFIQKGDYDKAQEILDLMPDKEDFISSIADKRMLQINIYLGQGETEKAIKELQSALLTSLTKVQMLLCKMIDAELAADNMQTAKNIAEKTSQMAILFDLWEYNSFIAPLQIASAEKDADECIVLLRKILAAIRHPWDMSSSPLFYHIAKIAKTSDPKQMLPAILSEMESTDAAYAFLQDHTEFRELLSEYKALLDK